MKSAHPSTEQQSHFTERSPRCEGRQASAGQKQPSGSGKRNQPASCQLRATTESATDHVDVALGLLAEQTFRVRHLPWCAWTKWQSGAGAVSA
jgi:hypothetical protein